MQNIMKHTITFLSKLVMSLCLCSMTGTFDSIEFIEKSSVLEKRNLLGKFNNELKSLGKIGNWLLNGKYIQKNIEYYSTISGKQWTSLLPGERWTSRSPHEKKYNVTYHSNTPILINIGLPINRIDMTNCKHGYYFSFETDYGPLSVGSCKIFVLSVTQYCDGKIKITGEYGCLYENCSKIWTIHINKDKEIVKCSKSSNCTKDIEIIKKFALYCSHFISFEKTDSKNHQFKWLKLLAEFDHHVANTSPTTHDETKMPKMPPELYKMIKYIHTQRSK